jgi:hypothetical protein
MIMPSYVSQCIACKKSGSVRLSFKEYDEVKDGAKCLVCNECEGACEIVFDPSSVQFVMKDGPSGGWVSKAIRENAWRANHREHMARRERDHVFKPKLQPNYKGVETGTWKDAKEYARTEVAKDFGKEVGNLTASTYDSLVGGTK